MFKLTNYTYTSFSVEDNGETLKDKKLKSAKETLKSRYKMDTSKVEEIVVFKVKYVVKFKGEEEDNTDTLNVIKYKGKWKCIEGDLTYSYSYDDDEDDDDDDSWYYS